MKINIKEFLKDTINISRKTNKEWMLYCFNYTALCQHEWNRNENRKLARWLVTDMDWNIIARPFSKFFNIEELENKPKWKFDVYEKLDWSLGIIYYWDWKRRINTKWSFDSEQSVKATEMLKGFNTDVLERWYTYLIEIIYKENQIVINYKEDMIVWLCRIDNETWQYDFIVPEWIKPRYFWKLSVEEILLLQEENKTNEEWFVCYWEIIFKVKFSDYVRLHRIATWLSEALIREAEYIPKWIEIENVPDELYEWIDSVKKDLKLNYKSVYSLCVDKYIDIMRLDRKTIATIIKDFQYSWVVFAMLDWKRDMVHNMVCKAIVPTNKKFLSWF